MQCCPAPKTVTRYEIARIIGLRALQIDGGATPFVPCKEGEQSIRIAAREISERKLDVIIDRNGEIVDVRTAPLPKDLDVVIRNGEDVTDP